MGTCNGRTDWSIFLDHVSLDAVRCLLGLELAPESCRYYDMHVSLIPTTPYRVARVRNERGRTEDDEMPIMLMINWPEVVLGVLGCPLPKLMINHQFGLPPHSHLEPHTFCLYRLGDGGRDGADGSTCLTLQILLLKKNPPSPPTRTVGPH